MTVPEYSDGTEAQQPAIFPNFFCDCGKVQCWLPYLIFFFLSVSVNVRYCTLYQKFTQLLTCTELILACPPLQLMSVCHSPQYSIPSTSKQLSCVVYVFKFIYLFVFLVCTVWYASVYVSDYSISKCFTL